MSRCLLILLLSGVAAAGCTRELPPPSAAGETTAERAADPAASDPPVQVSRRTPAPSDGLGQPEAEPIPPPSEFQATPEYREYEEAVAGLVLVFVPGGTFAMGAEDDVGWERERPEHRVSVSDFWIGKYEVTQAQWARVMGEAPAFFPGDDRPVERVSWDDVQEFLARLTETSGRAYRLPTEAEWEFAARDRGRARLWAGTSDLFEVAAVGWYGANSGGETRPVGRLRPNALGLHDMTGNVWEWCEDWFAPGYYGASPLADPRGPDGGTERVLRGGSCDNMAFDCRTTFRLAYPPEVRSPYIGFRIAVSEP